MSNLTVSPAAAEWRTLAEPTYGVGAGCSANVVPITTAVRFDAGQQMRVPDPIVRDGLLKGGTLDDMIVVEVPGRGLLDPPDSVRYFYVTASALKFEDETLALFDGTNCRRVGDQWQWQNHDGDWYPVVPDSVVAIAISAALEAR
jgi:hypothetical protein